MEESLNEREECFLHQTLLLWVSQLEIVFYFLLKNMWRRPICVVNFCWQITTVEICLCNLFRSRAGSPCGLDAISCCDSHQSAFPGGTHFWNTSPHLHTSLWLFTRSNELLLSCLFWWNCSDEWVETGWNWSLKIAFLSRLLRLLPPSQPSSYPSIQRMMKWPSPLINSPRFSM